MQIWKCSWYFRALKSSVYPREVCLENAPQRLMFERRVSPELFTRQLRQENAEKAVMFVRERFLRGLTQVRSWNITRVDLSSRLIMHSNVQRTKHFLLFSCFTSTVLVRMTSARSGPWLVSFLVLDLLEMTKIVGCVLSGYKAWLLVLVTWCRGPLYIWFVLMSSVCI